MTWSQAARDAALEARRLHMVNKRLHSLATYKVSPAQAKMINKMGNYDTRVRIVGNSVVGRPKEMIRLAQKLLHHHDSPIYGNSPSSRSMLGLGAKILDRKGR